jgi:hypothetical protein
MDFNMHRRNVIGGAGLVAVGGAAALSISKTPTSTRSAKQPKLLKIPAVAVPAGGEGVDLDAFLPSGFRRKTDDASQIFTAAADWSGQNRRPVFVRGRYFLANPVAIRAQWTQFQFTGAYIMVADNGGRLKTKFGQNLPLAFLVSADDVSLLGNVTLEGLGTPGETLLQGLYCEEAVNVSVGEFTLKNMAAGQHFMCCDNVQCGNTVAYSMWGRQPSNNERAGAGSAQVISGCRNSTFGRLQSWDNDKPTRYLSVGKTGKGERRDNTSNDYGFVEMTAREGSPWAQVTGIRSSVNSRFAGGSGTGVAFVLLCQKYKTDDAFSIDGNDFGSWSGVVTDRWGSVEAAGYFWVEDGALPIGSNYVKSLSASCPLPDPSLLNRIGYRFPQTFGIYMSSGRLRIDVLDVTGFSFQINAFDSHLDIGTFKSAAPFYQPVRYGHGLTGSIGTMKIVSDVVGPAANPGLLRAENLGKVGKPTKFRINQIDCSTVSTKIRAAYVVYDPLFDESAMQIGTLRGQCGSGQGFSKGRKRAIRRG